MDNDVNIKSFAKRNLVLYLSIAVIMISLTFKFSYAYFYGTVYGNDNVTPTTVDTAELKLQFLENESNYISATDMVILEPEEVAEKAESATFKIQNNSTIAATYKVYFDVTLSTNLISEDFKYQLTVGSQVFNGNFGGITKPVDPLVTTVTTSVELTSTDLTLAKDAIANGEFKLWLAETNQNQIGLTEGSFSGSLRITTVS